MYLTGTALAGACDPFWRVAAVGCHDTVLPEPGSQSSSVPTANGPTRNALPYNFLDARQPSVMINPANSSDVLSSGRCRCSFQICQLFAQVIRQPANRSDLGGTDTHSGFGLNAGSQLQVTQRIQAVVGQRLFRGNPGGRPQNDLHRHQTGGRA